MKSRLLRSLVAIPALCLLWLVSNSLGVTQTLNVGLHTNIPDAVKIPGLDRWLDGKDVPTPRDNDIPNSVASPMTKADLQAALNTLDTLPVKGRAPMTGYDRDEFGPEWSDTVGTWRGWSDNGCDTRNDTLRRDLSPKVMLEPGSRCDVASGTFIEPYSGQQFDFIAGNRSMEHSLDIDHVTALGNAWASGAWRWDEEKRARLANDPENLWAVSASLNRQKSDADAATWLPTNKAFRCTYVAQQIAVKNDYDLSVTSSEKDAMARVLGQCT